MKTTKVFIALFSVLAVANLFLSEWLIFGYVVLCLVFNVLLLHEERKNAQLTSKLTDAEIQVFIQRDEIKTLAAELDAKKAFEERQRAKQFELLVEISDLKTQLETAKANSYTEVERKRGREKYARLYKGKKKAEVATEQKSEHIKIEPFRMVVTPKQSEIVQQILFDNGYMWKGGDMHVKDTHIKALSFEGNKITSYDFYPHADSVYFQDTHLPKLSFSKFVSMYGKKQEPYTIEGKTIKQLVEENLGVEIETEVGDGFICGYDKTSVIIGLIKNRLGWSSVTANDNILKKYKRYYYYSTEDAISAIKKHRNIQ